MGTVREQAVCRTPPSGRFFGCNAETGAQQKGRRRQAVFRNLIFQGILIFPDFWYTNIIAINGTSLADGLSTS